MSDLKTQLKIFIYSACPFISFKTYVSSDNILTYIVIAYSLSLSLLWKYLQETKVSTSYFLGTHSLHHPIIYFSLRGCPRPIDFPEAELFEDAIHVCLCNLCNLYKNQSFFFFFKIIEAMICQDLYLNSDACAWLVSC